jgi:hypothetical protein
MNGLQILTGDCRDEIEQLRAEVGRLIKSRETWVDRCSDKDALIIELADALEQWVKQVGNTHPDWELIHRAQQELSK